jgi:hypothetical protein
MRIVAVILGISGLLVVAFDSYETIILPRRVGHKVKLAKIFYRVSWAFWSMIGRKLRHIELLWSAFLDFSPHYVGGSVHSSFCCDWLGIE